MIDEITKLLEVFKGLPDILLYVVAGIGLFKIVIYLSTTGAIYSILKTLIDKSFDTYNNKTNYKVSSLSNDMNFSNYDKLRFKKAMINY